MSTPTVAPPRDLLREEIKRLMKRKNIQAIEIVRAPELGVSKNSVYDYIGGKRTISASKASLILGYLRRARARRAA